MLWSTGCEANSTDFVIASDAAKNVRFRLGSNNIASFDRPDSSGPFVLNIDSSNLATVTDSSAIGILNMRAKYSGTLQEAFSIETFASNTWSASDRGTRTVISTGTDGSNGTVQAIDINNGYPSINIRRQGGSSTNWHIAGTTNYTNQTALTQVGSGFIVNGGSFQTGTGNRLTGTVTFPTAFAGDVVVTLSVNGAGTGAAAIESSQQIVIGTYSVTSTTFSWMATNYGSATVASAAFHWIAVGPRVAST